MELSQRKRQILKSVIDAYIALGAPVGSKYIAAVLPKPYSSATIRNEMNELEKLGFLEQPHTSAGRIPTRRGYRIYVDSLMEEYRLGFEETLLLNSLLSDRIREADKIISDMTKLLAEMTKYAVISFTRGNTGTIERFEGVYINRQSFLLVLITSYGRAITKQLQTDFPVSAKGVESIIAALNDHLAKKELGGITLERMIALENSLGEYQGIIGLLLKTIYDVIAEIGSFAVHQSGLSNLFAYPEFSDIESTGTLLRQLEQSEELAARLSQDFTGSIRVHIASEEKGIEGTSYVTCPYRLGREMSGMVCIIGPKRMNYAKVMARLEYLAEQINSAHGFEPPLPLIETKEKFETEEN